MEQPELAPVPKAATLTDLADCLRLLGERPLKLIADAVQPALHESPWNDSLWSFSRHAGAITDKKLLAFPPDSFQFSIANEHSRQEFHFHASVLEIYVSDSPIDLIYAKDGRQQTLAVPCGVLIVPPGVAHQVKLQGLTFVFQVAIRGRQVHNDKTVVDPPPTTAP